MSFFDEGTNQIGNRCLSKLHLDHFGKNQGKILRTIKLTEKSNKKSLKN